MLGGEIFFLLISVSGSFLSLASPHPGQSLISVLELRYFRIFWIFTFRCLVLAWSERGEVLSIVVFSRESQVTTFLEQSINTEYQSFTGGFIAILNTQ